MSSKSLCLEEKQYLLDALAAKKRNIKTRDITKYHFDILRDRTADNSMNDDVSRGNIDSRYSRLNHQEFLNKSQYLPFREDMFIGNKQQDPRGYTNDPIMENIKKYSYQRAKYTNATLYPRNAPKSVIDSQRPYKKIQQDMQESVRQRKKRTNVFSQSLTNTIFAKPAANTNSDPMANQYEQNADQTFKQVTNEQISPKPISLPQYPLQMNNLSVSDHRLPISDYKSIINAIQYDQNPKIMPKLLDTYANRHDVVNSIEKILEQLTSKAKSNNSQDLYTNRQNQKQETAYLVEKLLDQIKTIQMSNIAQQKIKNYTETVTNHYIPNEKYTSIAHFNLQIDPNTITKKYAVISQQLTDSIRTRPQSNPIYCIGDVNIFLQSLLTHQSNFFSQNQLTLIKSIQQQIKNAQQYTSTVKNAEQSTENICRLMQDISSIMYLTNHQINQQNKIDTAILTQKMQKSKLSFPIRSQILAVLHNQVPVVNRLDFDTQKPAFNLTNHYFNQQKEKTAQLLNIKSQNITWMHPNPEISAIQLILADQIARQQQKTTQHTVPVWLMDPANISAFLSSQDQIPRDLQLKLIQIANDISLHRSPNNFSSDQDVNIIQTYKSILFSSRQPIHQIVTELTEIDAKLCQIDAKHLGFSQKIPIQALIQDLIALDARIDYLKSSHITYTSKEPVQRLISDMIQLDARIKNIGSTFIAYTSKQPVKKLTADMIQLDARVRDLSNTSLLYSTKTPVQNHDIKLISQDIKLRTIFENMSIVRKYLTPTEIACIITQINFENQHNQKELIQCRSNTNNNTDIVQDIQNAEAKIYCNYTQILRNRSGIQQQMNNFGSSIQAHRQTLPIHPMMYDQMRNIVIQTDQQSIFNDETLNLSRNRNLRVYPRTHTSQEEKAYELST